MYRISENYNYPQPKVRICWFWIGFLTMSISATLFDTRGSFLIFSYWLWQKSYNIIKWYYIQILILTDFRFSNDLMRQFSLHNIKALLFNIIKVTLLMVGSLPKAASRFILRGHKSLKKSLKASCFLLMELRGKRKQR